MYKKLAIGTIVAVYLLIMVGGIVRASGSGMGCPDWPKCFGQWVPPTSADQLPEDYQELYGAKLKGEVVFNVFKTWTEYVNRLVGVTIGLLIFATMVAAIKTYYKSNKRIVISSVLAFILVVFEGWLGAKVVSSELHPGMVTIHMVLALVIVMLLIYALFLSKDFKSYAGRGDRSKLLLLRIALILSFGQLLLGTQIREEIDKAYLAGMERSSWIGTLGGEYYLHIGLAVTVLICNFFIYRVFSKMQEDKAIIFWMFGLVVAEFLTGGILGLAGMPAVAQPLHLTFATVIVGIQFYFLMKVRLTPNAE
jgi:cytochrome c oxidase assembly protein subunit 15